MIKITALKRFFIIYKNKLYKIYKKHFLCFYNFYKNNVCSALKHIDVL